MVIKVIEYYVLAFFFTTMLGALQSTTGILPETILPQWGPGLAGIIMLLIYRKDKLSLKFEFKRDEIKDYLLSIGYPILITGMVIAIMVVIQNAFSVGQLSLVPSIVTIGSALFGAIGEEIGWRGYLQPTLNKKLNLFWSSIITAALWAPWHIGQLRFPIVYVTGFFLAIFGYTFFISYLIKGTKFNLVIPVLFHMTVNLVSSAVPYSTVLSDQFMLTLGLVWIGAAAILVISNRKLFKQKA